MTGTRPTTSASNVARRSACPGSATLEEGMPDDSGDDAKEGTMLHAYMADPNLIPETLSQNAQDLLKKARTARDFIFQQTALTFGFDESEPFEESIEGTMWLHTGIRKLFPGTCDLKRWYPGPKVLLIVDYKFGFKAVTTAGANLQLRAYGCMAHEKHRDAEFAAVAIVQPRLSFDERITMAAYNREELTQSKEELIGIIEATKKPDAALVAGEEQCRYCKARLGNCPAFTAVISLQPNKEIKLDRLNNEQLNRILIFCQFADWVADQARDEARVRIGMGMEFGWALGKESEVRTITDVGAAAAILKAQGVTEAEIMGMMKMSLKPVEEKLRELGGLTWKGAKEKVNELLGPVIELSTKKAPLKRVGDSVPKIEEGAIEV